MLLVKPAPPVPTSLDALETSVDTATESPVHHYDDDRAAEQSFRHSGWNRHRKGILAAMETAGVSQTRTARMHACGTHAWVMRAADDPGRLKISASYCHDRFCLPCQTARAREIARSLAARIPDQTVRFLTLTLRGDESPLAERLDLLLASFRRLRQRAWWRRLVEGGVAIVEVKRSRDGRRWHPHLHVLVLGRYMPHSELSSEWEAASRGSCIVDIRLVRQRAKTLEYITTYAAKPMSHAASNSREETAEAIVALSGRRLVVPFGCLHGQTTITSPDHAEIWIPVSPLAEVIYLSASGDLAAREILDRLRRGDTCPLSRPPPTIYDSSPPPSAFVAA